MSKSLKTIAASILALIIASPALGKMPYPGFERDMALAFENDGEPMELALLSEQEMRETKGAVVPITIARSTYGGVSGALVYMLTHLGTGRFYWDGFSAYIITGALTANGLPGVTPGGRVILGGSAAAIVGRWFEAGRD